MIHKSVIMQRNFQRLQHNQLAELEIALTMNSTLEEAYLSKNKIKWVLQRQILNL